MHEYHPGFPCQNSIRPWIAPWRGTLYSPKSFDRHTCRNLTERLPTTCMEGGALTRDGVHPQPPTGPLWASLGLYCCLWPFSQATATHTHKNHTDTFHKLPTTRLHPEKGTIKKQTHTIKQATETMHKHLRPCSVCRSLGFYGPPWASLGLSSFLWPTSQATATHP